MKRAIWAILSTVIFFGVVFYGLYLNQQEVDESGEKPFTHMLQAQDEESRYLPENYKPVGLSSISIVKDGKIEFLGISPNGFRVQAFLFDIESQTIEASSRGLTIHEGSEPIVFDSKSRTIVFNNGYVLQLQNDNETHHGFIPVPQALEILDECNIDHRQFTFTDLTNFQILLRCNDINASKALIIDQYGVTTDELQGFPSAEQEDQVLFGRSIYYEDLNGDIDYLINRRGDLIGVNLLIQNQDLSFEPNGLSIVSQHGGIISGSSEVFQLNERGWLVFTEDRIGDFHGYVPHYVSNSVLQNREAE